MKITGMLWAVFLFCTGVVYSQESLSAKTDNFGDATVEKVLQVDTACRIYCDIADWPAIIGKEIPIQIRGLEPQANFDITVRTFILDTLNAALNNTSINDSNLPVTPAILLKNIQRGQTFCLVADIEIRGSDLGQMLVDRGYAKKLILPKTTEMPTQTSVAAPNTEKPEVSSPAQVSSEGYVASKSGKVFHKPTCSHAKRIQNKTKITYQTKEEAVAAGRRPCQSCNP
jgi:hypothetical protein